MAQTKLTQYRPWWHISQYFKEGAILQYLTTGIIVFGADYVIFFCAYQLLGFDLALATGVAYVVGLVTNFVLLRYWAFAKHAKRDYFSTNTAKYLIWLFINYILTYLALRYLELWFAITPYLGKFVVAFFMTFWNYAGYRLWVFRGPKNHTYKLKM